SGCRPPRHLYRRRFSLGVLQGRPDRRRTGRIDARVANRNSRRGPAVACGPDSWTIGTTTINIVFDHRGHQTSRRLAHIVASLVGALLVAIGLLATVVAIPSGFVTLGDLLGSWQHEQIYPPDFPVREVEIAFAASTTVAFLGLHYGRRLIRGH